jgi:hypothetical protein
MSCPRFALFGDGRILACGTPPRSGTRYRGVVTKYSRKWGRMPVRMCNCSSTRKANCCIPRTGLTRSSNTRSPSTEHEQAFRYCTGASSRSVSNSRQSAHKNGSICLSRRISRNFMRPPTGDRQWWSAPRHRPHSTLTSGGHLHSLKDVRCAIELDDERHLWLNVGDTKSTYSACLAAVSGRHAVDPRMSLERLLKLVQTSIPIGRGGIGTNRPIRFHG